MADTFEKRRDYSGLEETGNPALIRIDNQIINANHIVRATITDEKIKGTMVRLWFSSTVRGSDGTTLVFRGDTAEKLWESLATQSFNIDSFITL